MSDYATRCLSIRIGDRDFRLRALLDRQQFSDPDGAGDRAGISSAQWSLFGQPWPAGIALAHAMGDVDVDGLRILELGCGLGLASLVLQERGADITASDHHPLAASFLEYNAALNGLPPIPYHDLPWTDADHDLGRFDLIIGSDILYEHGHAALLSATVARHAHPRCEVLVADPGRGHSRSFDRAMTAIGYRASELRVRFEAHETAPFRGRLLRYDNAPGAANDDARR